VDDTTYMTTHEVATLLRTSPKTVRYWRRIGNIPPAFRSLRKKTASSPVVVISRAAVNGHGGSRAEASDRPLSAVIGRYSR
jgi:hypothetical protein